jgi:endo-1,4-beta-xylanase
LIKLVLMKPDNRYVMAAVFGLLGAFLVWLLIVRNTDPYVTQPPPQLPDPPLKELAERRGLQVGNFASLKYLRERAYAQILADEFDYVMADGEPNWAFEDSLLRPARGKFDFSQLDRVFDFADQNDLPVRFQHLLWGDEKWLPDWLKSGDYSDAELMDIIRDHIFTIAERYSGRAREYTVVNEAFSRRLNKGGNQDWWGQRLGNDYIDAAFIWANEADPDAVLILNDFGNEYQSDISDLTYDYVKGALSRGVPIDAIGMQMHIDGNSAAATEDVVENMKRFAGLGLKIYITEFDVNMHNVHEDDEAEFERQAQIYADMVGACLEVGAEICPSFGFLGLVDRQSWYHGIGINDANPLMFTNDYEPKPAFFAVRRALEER